MGNSNSLSTSAVDNNIPAVRKTKLFNKQSGLDATPDHLHNIRRYYGKFKKHKINSSDIVVIHHTTLEKNDLSFDGESNNQSEESFYGMPGYENMIDPAGIIIPRKLPYPAKDNPELRELQREIAFNNKMGINVLGQKSELQKAMERMRGQLTKKQLDEDKKQNRSDLEREFEKRAMRLKKYEEDVMAESTMTMSYPESENEFHRIHAKVNGRFASTTSTR